MCITPLSSGFCFDLSTNGESFKLRKKIVLTTHTTEGHRNKWRLRDRERQRRVFYWHCQLLRLYSIDGRWVKYGYTALVEWRWKGKNRGTLRKGNSSSATLSTRSRQWTSQGQTRVSAVRSRRGGAVGWGTELQVGRSRVRFAME